VLFDKYNPKATIKDLPIDHLIALQAFSCAITKEALLAFAQGDLEKFYPEVGDQACQIRTDMITDFNARPLPIQNMLPYITITEQKIKNCTSKFRNHQNRLLLKKSNPTIECFLENEGIDLHFSNEAKIITLCYFLTKYKVANWSFDYKKANKESGLTRNFIADLRHHAQEYLQRITIAYIQQKAQKLCTQTPVLFDTHYLREQSSGIQQINGSNHKFSVPFLLGLTTLFENMLHQEKPFVLKMNTVCKNGTHVQNLLFSVECNQFVLQNSIPPALASCPTSVVEGEQFDGTWQEYEKRKETTNTPCQKNNCTAPQRALHALLKIPITDVIFANAAAHPQFPGDKDIDFTTLPRVKKEFDRFSQLAKDEGMCRENMKTFLVTHVYPSTIGNALGSYESQELNQP